jgi:hypothetical protein
VYHGRGLRFRARFACFSRDFCAAAEKGSVWRDRARGRLDDDGNGGGADMDSETDRSILSVRECVVLDGFLRPTHRRSIC